MKKSLLLTLSLFLLLLFFTSYLAFRSGWLASFFSAQHTIDPDNLPPSDYDYTQTGAIFDNQNLLLPTWLANLPQPPKQVLSDTTETKRIEIDLTNQHLKAYEGDRLVYDFLVSTGKWARTPIGEFQIWTKLRYTKMAGGSKALRTYYYLPNVPYVMYFYNDAIPKYRGFGIHGTYWHNNFGHPMSHGCINMKTEEAELLYYWAQPHLSDGKNSVYASAENPGTRIVIYGEAPWQ